MKATNCNPEWDEFPWEKPAEPSVTAEKDRTYEDTYEHTQQTEFSIGEVSRLLDRMVMDIQHLELEVIRTRYKLSLNLKHPYGEYLRAEIFSGLGSRYGGNPVYDRYLNYLGLDEYDDAIDTTFHVKRMQRLACGYDDYPDLYP